MKMKETNDVVKVINDKLINEGVFLIQYRSMKDFIANRLIEYIAKHFHYTFDLNTHSEKMLNQSLELLDKQIKAYGIDLSVKIPEDDKMPMCFAVDFVFELVRELINSEYVQLELKELTEESVTFKAVILLDKKKEYERFPRLMTEKFSEYTGTGPFDEEMEVLFEHRKKFVQLKAFSEVLDYTYGLVDEMQNRYKEQCIHQLQLKK